ncbi:MAG: Fic family protein [Flavobacteriales bacterium]
MEATLPDGSRTEVFITTPHGVETEDAMRALVAWYAQPDAVHPLVRVAAFCYEFVTIHPFQDGNGRLSRLLATLLLLQQSYPWVQYVSFEHEIERRKSEYYRVLRTCQANRPGEDVGPWLHFFLDCLVVMMEQLRAKLEAKGAITDLNERQRNILRYVQAHAGAQAGGIAKALSIPLPTVKKDLETMVAAEVLLREGAGRGTHYSAR